MNASPPRVTLAMPVYNREEFLADTIESLLDQTFTDFELIITDDASTDGTGDIARHYADRDHRIRYWRNPRNMGIYFNFNLPLMWARGEYFMWAGQDDLWEPTFLERMVSLLDNDPGAVMALPALDHIDAQDKVFRQYPRLAELDATDHLDALHRFIVQDDALGKTNAFHGLMRTKILQGVGGYIRWSRYGFGEDTLLAFRVLCEGRLRVDREPLWHKRWVAYSLGATIWPPRGSSFAARLRGVLIDFRDLYSYMRGYSRILRTQANLSLNGRVRLNAAVRRRTLHVLAAKLARTVAAGLRQAMMRGPKRELARVRGGA